IFCHSKGHVDKIVKLLKTKVSILQKFLDTAFRCPIRFRQKVLMVFFELRWNYSPLKEKAVLLPDGLFVCFLSLRCASLHTAIVHFFLLRAFLLLMQAARHVVGLAASTIVDKICREQGSL